MKREKRPLKIDWLKMERQMRKVLRGVEQEKIQHLAALVALSNILGYHTGRGYEFDLSGTLQLDPSIGLICFEPL